MTNDLGTALPFTVFLTLVAAALSGWGGQQGLPCLSQMPSLLISSFPHRQWPWGKADVGAVMMMGQQLLVSSKKITNKQRVDRSEGKLT
jgi:hypothetical protein